MLEHFLQRLHHALLEGSILLLGPPVSDLRKASLTEVFFEHLIFALVNREESEHVFDPSALQGAGKMFHVLLGQVCVEDHRNDVNRYI